MKMPQNQYKRMFILIFWLLFGLGMTFLIGSSIEPEGRILIIGDYYRLRGFPAPFIKICVGECIDEPSYTFNYFYFFVDYIFWLAVIYFIYFIFQISKSLWKYPEGKKNWRVILLIIGTTILVINDVLGLIIPYSWKYMKYGWHGYIENPLYLITRSLATLLIILAVTFLLAQLVSKKFYKSGTELNSKTVE